MLRLTTSCICVLFELLLLLAGCQAAPVNASVPSVLPNTTACAWSGPNDFVNQVLAQKLNVTDIVLRCPSSCIVVYGSGNPDISGKGIMISYFAQFGFVGFCSLILPVMAFATANSPWRDGKPKLAIEILRKCQSTVNEISVFYSLSIFIAAVVRFIQTPPIFEIIFIQNLIHVQTTIIVTMLLFRVYDFQFNDIPVARSHTVYDLGNLLAQLVTSYTISLRHDSFPVFFELCQSCNRFYAYTDASSYFAPTQDAGSSAKYWGIGIGISIGSMVVGGLLGYFFQRIRRVFPRWLRKYWHHILVFQCVLLYIALFVLLARRLDFVRNYTTSPEDGGGGGDDWGYGQTTAVLLWAPVLRTAFKAAWKMRDRQAVAVAPTTTTEEHELATNATQHPVAAPPLEEPPPAYQPGSSRPPAAPLPSIDEERSAPDPAHPAAQSPSRPVAEASGAASVSTATLEVNQATVGQDSVHPTARTSSWETETAENPPRRRLGINSANTPERPT